MNPIEKLLAHAAGRDTVTVGDQLSLPVDLLLVHDGSGGKFLDALPADAASALPGSHVVVTLDHGLPAPTPVYRERHLRLREFCRKHGITLYERGEGIMHQVAAERHRPLPGQVVVGADGHVLTSTAFGALCFAENAGNTAKALVSGHYDLTVPETVTVSFTGVTAANVTAKDLALALLRDFGLDGLRDRLLLVHGAAVTGLDDADRMTFCNLFGELGVRCAALIDDLDPTCGDVHTIAADALVPLAATPPDPAHVRAVSELDDVAVSQVVIGGCTNGRLQDIAAAAGILAGRTVHPDVTLVVMPASSRVADAMDAAGHTAAIRAAGGIVTPPGCGSCGGAHQGVAGADDVIATTTVRNTPGRMGAESARIYLVSPETAAFTALAGRITDHI